MTSETSEKRYDLSKLASFTKSTITDNTINIFYEEYGIIPYMKLPVNIADNLWFDFGIKPPVLNKRLQRDIHLAYIEKQCRPDGDIYNDCKAHFEGMYKVQ